MKHSKQKEMAAQSKPEAKQETGEQAAHAACNAKVAELTDLAKRTQADFENYKKRADAEKAQYVKYAGSVVMAKLLPLLDTFDSAIKNTANKEAVHAVELIRNDVHAILKAEGIIPIKSVGEHFDPFRHEALMTEETRDPAKDNMVIEEFQKGYMLHDKVLRHSKVKVAKYKAPKEPSIAQSHTVTENKSKEAAR